MYGKLNKSSMTLPALILLVTGILTAWSVTEHVLATGEITEKFKIERRNKLDSAAKRVTDVFDSAYSTLLHISLDPAVASLGDKRLGHVEKIFEHSWKRDQFSEIYIVEKDFDATKGPFRSFEFEDGGEKLHTLEREEEEYNEIKRHIATFENQRNLQAILSDKLKLCVNDEEGEQLLGNIYSLPIRLDGEFVGLVAGMIPSRVIEAALLEDDGSSMNLLTNGERSFVCCDKFPKALERLVAAQLESDDLLGLFPDSEGDVLGSYEYLKKEISFTSGHRWWLVSFADKKLTAAKVAEFTNWGDVLAIFFLGILLAAFTHSAQNNIESQKTHIAELKGIEAQLQESNRAETVRNEMLRLSVEEEKLREKLEKFIDLIVQLPWLSLENKGAIFLLSEKDDLLEMAAQKNLSPELHTMCKTVELGHCLCGRAAAEAKTVFANHLDEKHDVRFEGMSDHGHYCVPMISSRKKLLGVFTLYTRAGAERNERVESFLASVADIISGTIERARDRDNIENQAGLLRATFQSTNDGIVVVDERGRITQANENFSRMWAIPGDLMEKGENADILQHSAAQLIDPEGFKARIQGLYESPEKENDKIFFTDGRVFERQSNPLLREGRIKGRVWNFRDVTLREQQGKEKALLEKQLQDTRKLEAVGTLAGGMAHEFNNLLTSIIGYADLTADMLDEDSTERENIGHILQSATRAAELIEELLSYTRGKEEELTVIEAHRLVARSVKDVREMLPSNILLQESLDEDCGNVLANPREINKTILNICTNAYQAMTNGGQLQIGLSKLLIGEGQIPSGSEVEAGQFVRLSIEDNGAGMDEETLGRIFEPFYSTKDIGEGHGLGLSVAHGIIRSHGGFIKVESTKGEGTRVDVHLPVYKMENSAA